MSDQFSGREMATMGPLLPTDPARVGEYWLDARLTSAPAGVAFSAHDNEGTPALLLLTSAGAAGDPNARDRLAGEVNKLHVDTVLARGGEGQDAGRLGIKFRDTKADPVPPDTAALAPWVALAFDGSAAAVAEATRILRAIDLSDVAELGKQSGPDYELHWIDQTSPGKTRLWPLPWPGRYDRAGWMTILISWLLMILLAALAILLAILLFQNAPPQAAPAPVPTSGSETMPASPSGSPSGSGRPTPPSPSLTPSMGDPSPGESESGGSTPSPNRRL